MKKLSILTMILCFAVAAFAQNKGTRSLKSFDRISVGESVSVTLVKGSSEKAEIEVSGADVDDVETKVSDGKLTVGMASGSYRNVKVRAIITYVSLEKVSVSSSASVKSDDTIKSSRFEASASSSGYMSLSLDVDRLEVSANSSGTVKLAGNADEIKARVNSSGDIRAYDLRTRDADVSANSSGRAEINVSDSLDARANSSGKVVYKGSPGKVNASANSSGKVQKA